MKVGISLYSYCADLHSHKMKVSEAIEHAAEIGCEGVEVIADQHLPNWPYTSPADIAELRKQIESLGMEVTCLSTYLSPMLRTDRNQTREELVNEAKKHIILANGLGAKLCRPAYAANSMEELAATIQECLPVLEANNVTWVCEVHSPFPPSFYNDVIKAVNSPYVRLLPDFSCWQTNGLPSEYSSNEISTFIDVLPYTAYCHGKAHMFNEEGEEPNTPYKELLRALKDYHYEGYIMAEYEGWLMKYEDSRKIAKIHVELLKKYACD